VADFVEVPLPGGGSLIVEQGEDEHVVRAGRAQQIAQTAGESFESALDRVKRAAMVVHDKLQGTPTPPDEVVVEFSIKLAAEVGVVVASSSAEANLKLVMRWGKSEAADE
jgi:Trypsin-co-occurring domain 1